MLFYCYYVGGRRPSFCEGSFSCVKCKRQVSSASGRGFSARG